MADISVPVQPRTAAQLTSPAVAVRRLRGQEILVVVTGLTAAELQDPTLEFIQAIEGNPFPAGNPSAWIVIYGPDTWTGGNIGKDGIFHPPTFSWRAEQARDIARVRLTIDPNRATSWGVDVTLAP